MQVILIHGLWLCTLVKKIDACGLSRIVKVISSSQQTVCCLHWTSQVLVLSLVMFVSLVDVQESCKCTPTHSTVRGGTVCVLLVQDLTTVRVEWCAGSLAVQLMEQVRQQGILTVAANDIFFFILWPSNKNFHFHNMHVHAFPFTQSFNWYCSFGCHMRSESCQTR